MGRRLVPVFNWRVTGSSCGDGDDQSLDIKWRQSGHWADDRLEKFRVVHSRPIEFHLFFAVHPIVFLRDDLPLSFRALNPFSLFCCKSLCLYVVPIDNKFLFSIWEALKGDTSNNTETTRRNVIPLLWLGDNKRVWRFQKSTNPWRLQSSTNYWKKFGTVTSDTDVELLCPHEIPFIEESASARRNDNLPADAASFHLTFIAISKILIFSSVFWWLPAF